MPLSQFSRSSQQASTWSGLPCWLAAESQGLVLGASVMQCANTLTRQGWRSRVVTLLLRDSRSSGFPLSLLVSTTCKPRALTLHSPFQRLHYLLRHMQVRSHWAVMRSVGDGRWLDTSLKIYLIETCGMGQSLCQGSLHCIARCASNTSWEKDWLCKAWLTFRMTFSPFRTPRYRRTFWSWLISGPSSNLYA